MIKHPLYDIAVSEVRGDSTPEEDACLKANVFDWRDGLLSVIDEVNAQLDLKDEEYSYELEDLEQHGTDLAIEEIKAGHNLWRNRALRFRKHVKARLDAVKRMCQDQLEGAEGHTYDLEGAMRIVSASIALVAAEEDGDSDLFDHAFDALESTVGHYLNG